jgi:hypothetical protein
MKTYIDKEFVQYLLDAHDDFNNDNFLEIHRKSISDSFPIFELAGILADSESVKICVYIDKLPVCLNCPPDIFAGTNDFCVGLNHGLNRAEFDPWGTIL